MQKPFVFFDLGQTLVSEWDFIGHFDNKFQELLNGFGARIDMRNYKAVRDSIIRDRRIGHGSVRELIGEVCKVVLPAGYGPTVAERIEPEIKEGRRALFRFAEGAEQVLQLLSVRCDLGIIANQSEDILGLLASSGLEKYFKVKTISGIAKLKKPDLQIFQLALKEAGKEAGDCIMVGDRLDTDICPANRLGMSTVRVIDSLFALQQPKEECELATRTAIRLLKVPKAVEEILAQKGKDKS
ncbi:MAG: HAD family hydrolase [Nitrososphaera sp.]|uniref:HAD family hydrolase n=1 Tax=Nitrososphaera sp. TaxID=1971748 RepID=UPI003D6ED44A